MTKTAMSYVKSDLKDIQDLLRGLGIKKRIYETSMALKCTLTGLKTGFLWGHKCSSVTHCPSGVTGLL